MKVSALKFKNSILERIKDLTRTVAPREATDTSKQIINYGLQNDFPIKLAETVEKSPTGQSNIDVIQKFLKGQGFNNDAINDFEINKEQKFISFHSDIADQLGLFEGFSIRTTYDKKTLKLNHAHALQFQGARFQIQNKDGSIDNIFFNPWYGTVEYDIKHTRIYPVFDPEAVKKQIKVKLKFSNREQGFQGQCLYFGKTTPTSPFYPRPGYWSAKSWFRCDWLIGEFHENNIDNNFLLAFIVEMIGDPNAPSTHPDDKRTNETTKEEEIIRTVGERFDLDMGESLSGAIHGGVALVIWQAIVAGGGDTKPRITPFPSNAMDTLFITLAKLITENIARATKVPPLLANIEQSGSLSDASKIREATELMNKLTEPERMILEFNYKMIFRAMADPPQGWEDLKIIPLKEREAVPDNKIWEAMTIPERRAWIAKNTDIELLEEGEGAPDQIDITDLSPLTFNRIWDGLAEDEKRRFLKQKTSIELTDTNNV